MICGLYAPEAKFDWAPAQPDTAAITFQSKQSITNLPEPKNPFVKHLFKFLEGPDVSLTGKSDDKNNNEFSRRQNSNSFIFV